MLVKIAEKQHKLAVDQGGDASQLRETVACLFVKMGEGMRVQTRALEATC
jgi:putative component of toxin-antitoxin plasmid stabilization module